MVMTKEELRKKYPMVLFEETHWEVYDEVDARIVAHFFSEDEALAYLEWRNNVSEDYVAATIVNEVSEEEFEKAEEESL